MQRLGIVLVVLGIVAIIYGVFGYERQTTILDVGGIKATATERKTVPIAPIIGGMALIGGVLLLVATKRGT
jgi:hypothetical protein